MCLRGKLTFITFFYRMVELYVEDADGVGSLQNSTLVISISPVNDPPILSFVMDESLRSSEPYLLGSSTAAFQYTEDDPELNFGRDIYLRDVDSNIASATLQLTGELSCSVVVVVVVVIVITVISTHP